MKAFNLMAVVLGLLPLAVHAELQPIPLKEDSRIKQVIFQENNVVPIKASTFTSTQILFGPKETVIDVEGGDTSAWIVTHHTNLPNQVFIKPTMLHSDTNMTVVTNRHTYYFHVTSNEALEVNPSRLTYAIQFRYPQEEQALLKAKLKKATPQVKDPKALHKNYRFSGNPQLIPQHVFDDGRFTYFELRPNQPVPAIFAVDDRQGKEAMVNTRRQGNYLVVQRLAPQFTLRNGGLVASVFNIQEIARIKQGRG